MGDTTAALFAGGYRNPPAGSVANAEDWNGASWVEVADLSAARENHTAAGTSTAGFVISGNSPPDSRVTSTEEWSSSTNSTKTIDTD